MCEAIEIMEPRLQHRQSSNFTRSTMSKMLSNQNPSQTYLDSSNASGAVKQLYEGSEADRARRFDDIQINSGVNNHLYIKSEEFRMPQQKSSRIFN